MLMAPKLAPFWPRLFARPNIMSARFFWHVGGTEGDGVLISRDGAASRDVMRNGSVSLAERVKPAAPHLTLLAPLSTLSGLPAASCWHVVRIFAGPT